MQRKPVVKCFYIRGCDATDVKFKTFSLHSFVKTGQNAAKLWHQPLKKVVIEKVHMKKVSIKSKFVSNLFLVKKKDGDNRPVIKLKNVNQYKIICVIT